MNPNLVSSEERLANYIAGQQIMRNHPDYRTAKEQRAIKEWGRKTLIEIGSPQVVTKLFKQMRRKGGIQQNPIVPNMADYTNWLFWDRIVFAAGASIPTNFKLFVIPNGTGGKTKVDTNLDQPSQLPQPYWMNATQIGFYWHPTTLLLDVINFENQSYFEWWVNNKVYIEGPFQAFGGMSGLHGATTNTSQQALSNGVPLGLASMYDLRLPAGVHLGFDANSNPVISDGLTGVSILQSQTFKIEVNLPGGVLPLTAADATPNPGNGLTPYVFLHGILSRSVQ